MVDLFLKLKENAALLWYEKTTYCLLCGNVSEESVCLICQQAYFFPNLPRCGSCGKILAGTKTRCRNCETGKGPEGLDMVTCLGYYKGAWKELVQQIKYKGQPYLLASLAEVIIPWVIRCLPPPDAVVPVPMHPDRLAQRGFNQAEVLASIISRQLAIPYQNLLDRMKDTIPQTTLGRRQRLRNLRDAFSVKPGYSDLREIVWLVDDVVTTGSTLEECAGVLKKNGVKKVYAFCLGAGKEE
ncbi:Competence protein F, phosphoribosyltransferase domain protein [Dehalobacter sp. UNSWDHB]|jgi:Predicted amidophosphoribosyltransferases|uniref:ComF family protein n=1 Tax=unclassified Dehalobacter TaxID=2635733 RepID=UPI00028B782D|nr:MULTISPECIES: ComF family protein [unclassified Dehalobacter]AFV03883.1 Competence protein F-like protein, phosphoribosyltransferase domain; protein YhgH required for utilization of DNA as sole source of carbon and energy [Dehalobacter sp. DCA]AFV06861.1 Competence protein F-like protein, phosphoribosyltransferase domain; protein YhgH required for utilization of DNA as sole source of carbon and energy [Dehalobacter sp. CF]EQB21379.1 Competence protein F, phosphoribosyltransferase domain prote